MWLRGYLSPRLVSAQQPVLVVEQKLLLLDQEVTSRRPGTAQGPEHAPQRRVERYQSLSAEHGENTRCNVGVSSGENKHFVLLCELYMRV